MNLMRESIWNVHTARRRSQALRALGVIKQSLTRVTTAFIVELGLKVSPQKRTSMSVLERQMISNKMIEPPAAMEIALE